MVLVLLKVGERNFENTALESVVGVLETSGSVHESLADTALREFQCSDQVMAGEKHTL